VQQPAGWHGASARNDEEEIVPGSSGGRADPVRFAFLEATRVPSPVDQVAAAIAAFSEYPGSVYVERFGDAWRWSPAHRGGSYPLLRVVARFMRIDHDRIMVPFRTVEDGWAVLNLEDGVAAKPDATAVVTFTEAAMPEAVKQRLAEVV
jgi:hypothetical protein